MYDPFAEFEKNVLPNGLEVHSAFWNRPWIKVEFVVHAGAREDPVAIPGLAHFVEHATSKNVDGYAYADIKEHFNGLGGEVELGSITYLSTRYGFTVPADPIIFRQALTIFGLMLFGAKLEKNIERERKVIEREFNEDYPFLEKLEWKMAIRRALFKGHRRLETYNRPLGRPEGFMFVQQLDLQDFYDRYYTPHNISVAIVGGIQSAEILAAMQDCPLGMNKPGKRNLIPSTSHDISRENRGSMEKVVKMSDHVNFKIDQTGYSATWALPAHVSRFALIIFRQVLNQILDDEIRQKRALAYATGVAWTEFQDVREFEVGSSVSPSATEAIGEIVQECIATVPTRGDLVANKILASVMRCKMVDLSGSGLVGEACDDLSAYQRIVPISEELTGRQSVRIEEIAEIADLLSEDDKYTHIACP